MKHYVDQETGEFQIFDPDVSACPHAAYAQFRAACPVGRAHVTGAPVLTRYEDVAWALRHPEIFSSEMGELMALGNERPMIPQQIDPPSQTDYRRILDPLFSRKRMAELVPDIRSHASALIDDFVEKGACEFDEAFAIPLPCTAFLSLFGLPVSELPLFLELKDGIIRPQKFIDDQSDPDKASAHRKATGQRIYDYFEDEIAKHTKQSKDGLLGTLLTTEFGGRKLTHHEILDICYLLLLAGLDTVTATLGCNIAYLAANPEQRRRLVDRPDLIPGAVEELMRWETPVAIVPRLVKQDCEVGGHEIKSGEIVTLLIGAANTDDAHFSDAQRVDFERGRNIHLAFGGGPHRCLGSHLARMELVVAMEEWHRRIPDYSIKAGETPLYSTGIREVSYLPLVWDV